MEFVRTCISAFAVIALLAMAVPLAPAHASHSADRGSPAAGCDFSHHTEKAVPVGQDSPGELDVARHGSTPTCPVGCPHSTGLGCCGLGVPAIAAMIVVAISVAGDLPYKADRSLSGFEPDAPQEPPQLSA
jgi:hypothetical protein